MRLILFLIAAGTIYGQTVAGQTTSGAPPQTASASVGFKKVPKLVVTLACPGVPQDAAGSYLVIGGASVNCLVTVNIAPTAASGTSVALSSSDTTQFTVPANVLIPMGQTTSPVFPITATP